MYRVKTHAGLKEASNEKSIVAGYASIFNNIDSDNEMIIPGAFAKSLNERGPQSSTPRIKHLWQHSTWEPIGLPVTMEERDKGLYFESKFGSDTFSQDKLKQHVDGLITEFSIGFQVVKSEDVLDDSGNRQYRKLVELKLWEISSVTWGANSLTHITDIKTATKKDRFEQLEKRQEKLIRALRDVKYSDESKEQFEIEYRQIHELIKSLLNEPSQDTQKETQPIEEMEKAISIFSKINL